MNLSLNTCFCIQIIFIVCANCSSAFDLLEFIFGPRLGNSQRVSAKSLDVPSAQNLIQERGYPFQQHEVISETGHILSLHRIPFGIKRKSRSVVKPVALFQHGLLAASDTWLFKGPDKNLPFLLADAGYDVWLGNMRGNVYSKKHTTLNPDRDKEYWKYSVQDVAFYDMPAIIDYILNLTGQHNLYFLGHSIGSTAGLILCSMKPEYNSKIKLHLALAPLVYSTHPLNLPHRILTTSALYLSNTLIAQNIYSFFPRRPYISNLLEVICKNGMPTQSICLSSLFLTVGPNYPQFNTSEMSQTVSYFPAGTSTQLFMHTLQLYATGNFAALNYGNSSVNFIHYKSKVPPYYNLTKVTSPISLHYGDGDFLVTEEDIHYLGKQLPNLVGKFLVPYKNFNHMDFMFGVDAKKLLYNRLILLMNKYRNR